MVPSRDVVTATIRVVLQANGVHEVCVLQLRVECFDFFVECHHAAFTSEPDNVVLAAPPAIVEVFEQ